MHLSTSGELGQLPGQRNGCFDLCVWLRFLLGRGCEDPTPEAPYLTPISTSLPVRLAASQDIWIHVCALLWTSRVAAGTRSALPLVHKGEA